MCGHAPPNLATLTLFDQFPSPSRQPRLVETKGFDGAYQGLLAGKCVGTVLPLEAEGKTASRQIAATFGGSEFVAVTKDDYAGYDGLLKNTWGFELRR